MNVIKYLRKKTQFNDQVISGLVLCGFEPAPAHIRAIAEKAGHQTEAEQRTLLSWFHGKGIR